MYLLNALYILIIIIGTAAQSVIKKSYGKKGDRGVFIFSAMSVTCACLFFLIKSGFKINVSGEIVPYAILFAVGYSMAVVFNFLAISAGSLSLSSLAMSYSLLIPTAYGLIFDNDKASLFFYLGILLLAVSLFLINSKKGDNEITLKWAVFAVLSLVGNGVCSTVLTVQSAYFGGKYDSSFMVIALSIVAAVLFTVAFFKEKEKLLPSIKGGWGFMVACGVANALVNLFVMLGGAVMDKSLMFPLVSAGGIIATWLIAAFVYKEKLTKTQNIGMLLGVASIVF